MFVVRPRLSFLHHNLTCCVILQMSRSRTSQEFPPSTPHLFCHFYRSPDLELLGSACLCEADGRLAFSLILFKGLLWAKQILTESDKIFKYSTSTGTVWVCFVLWNSSQARAANLACASYRIRVLRVPNFRLLGLAPNLRYKYLYSSKGLRSMILRFMSLYIAVEPLKRSGAYLRRWRDRRSAQWFYDQCLNTNS